MTWHDLFTLQNLPIGTSGHDMTQVHPGINIGLQYIRNASEYILKLQLHQHSLLTRKVFYRHNFHHWSSSLDHLVICIFKSSSSSSPLHLQVIFIFRSGSSLDPDHHWTLPLDQDHHSIWIIIGFGSSLDLDHHCWIIITRSRSSLLDLDHLGDIITGSRSSFDLDHHY